MLKMNFLGVMIGKGFKELIFGDGLGKVSSNNRPEGHYTNVGYDYINW